MNDARFDRFDDLADIDIDGSGGGRPAVGVVRSRSATRFPYVIGKVERHPLGSQAFIPLGEFVFVVVVAPPGESMAVADLAGVRHQRPPGDQLQPRHLAYAAGRQCSRPVVPGDRPAAGRRQSAGTDPRRACSTRVRALIASETGNGLRPPVWRVFSPERRGGPRPERPLPCCGESRRSTGRSVRKGESAQSVVSCT